MSTSGDSDSSACGAPAARLPVRRRGRRADEGALEPPGEVPDDGLPWGEGPHGSVPRLLTADDPRAPTPEHFLCQLRPPQQTLLHALIELEQTGRVAAAPAADYGPGVIMTNGVRLDAPAGFGKTMLVVALAQEMANRARRGEPYRMRPELAPAATLPVPQSTCGKVNFAICCYGGVAARVLSEEGSRQPSLYLEPAAHLPELTIRYARGYPNLSVVFASPNVIRQWVDHCDRFAPTLRYFVVENARTLQEFCELLSDGRARGYDLLFCKAGTVTSSFRLPGEGPPIPMRGRDGQPRAEPPRSLFFVLARLLENAPVARVVIDDFDSVKARPDCRIPAAGFVYFVSATRRQTPARWAVDTTPRPVGEFLRGLTPLSTPLTAHALNDVLNNTLRLTCEAGYARASIAMPAPLWRRVVIIGGAAAVVMRALGAPEDALEAVNAGAIGAAAGRLHVAADTLGGLLRACLGRHAEMVGFVRRAVARLELAAAAPPRAARPDAEPFGIDEYETAEEEEAAAMLGDLRARRRAVAYPALHARLVERKAELKQYEVTLGRMRDNIREGECAVCHLDFEPGLPVHIMADCCQIVLCDHCMTSAVVARKICPNCMRPMQRPVRVGPEVDLLAALSDEQVRRELGDGTPADGNVMSAAAAAAADDEDADSDDDAAAQAQAAAALISSVGLGRVIEELREAANWRLLALVRLVAQDEAPEFQVDDGCAPYVANLLVGPEAVPRTDQPRRILVFTTTPGASRAVDTALRRAGIPVRGLGGPRSHKEAAVAWLAERCPETRVIVVTAAKDCGGLHMPFLTDVIYYHRVADRNVQTQVAARGQRPGRECSIRITVIANSEEVAQMNALDGA